VPGKKKNRGNHECGRERKEREKQRRKGKEKISEREKIIR